MQNIRIRKRLRILITTSKFRSKFYKAWKGDKPLKHAPWQMLYQICSKSENRYETGFPLQKTISSISNKLAIGIRDDDNDVKHVNDFE